LVDGCFVAGSCSVTYPLLPEEDDLVQFFIFYLSFFFFFGKFFKNKKGSYVLLMGLKPAKMGGKEV
jgi:hypothetical protein